MARLMTKIKLFSLKKIQEKNTSSIDLKVLKLFVFFFLQFKFERICAVGSQRCL